MSFSTPYAHNDSKSRLLYFSFNSLIAPTTVWADVVNEYPEKEEPLSSIELLNVEVLPPPPHEIIILDFRHNTLILLLTINTYLIKNQQRGF